MPRVVTERNADGGLLPNPETYIDKRFIEKSNKEFKILIGVPTPGYSRRDDFYDYFNLIQVPDNVLAMKTFARSQSPARNRNIIIEQALSVDCTHILFIDDDVMVKPDVLTRLLAHDKDIVGGLYMMRSYPHFPIAFTHYETDGRARHFFLDKGVKGLVKVDQMGLGCVLIKMDVFKNMEKPWVRLGEFEKDHWQDDFGFYHRAQLVGYQLWLDLDCVAGHVISSIAWPDRDADGKWYTVIDSSGKGNIKVPQICSDEIKKVIEMTTLNRTRTVEESIPK